VGHASLHQQHGRTGDLILTLGVAFLVDNARSCRAAAQAYFHGHAETALGVPNDFQIPRTPDADAIRGVCSRNAATQYANGRRDHRDIARAWPRRRALLITRG
jgi:hypothetical protein